jgi:hypothetical protein
MRYAVRNCPVEWEFRSGKAYDDPFNDVQLDVLFETPGGTEQRVPAYWAGEQAWRVRYASPEVGVHRYRSVCSDAENPDLHGVEGTLEVSPYEGDNPLLKHGPLRVAESCTHLQHQDGTPFFWLADTWWMGLVKRLRWPQDFQLLAADRIEKGYSVIQIVAGLYPDMPPFDPRGANEAGFPWSEDYSQINPAYFDAADLRINWLVDSGLVPCIVACWGYHIEFAGEETLKKHWRYLVARYGALPVVWCLAGEVLMPYYLSERRGDREGYVEFARPRWESIGRYVRETDPYGRVVTVHPGGGQAGRDSLDESLSDFDMLQTGHGDRDSFPGTVKQVTAAVSRMPRMPVINGEVTYEGIRGNCWQDVQRLMFWTCMLSGACGHTYGANGIWQINLPGAPFGPSPHGRSWGDTPWTEAYRLPGSRQLGLGKRLLERYRWWLFEPHPEWADPHWTEGNFALPYAAGIPGEVRVIFLPLGADLSAVVGLEAGVEYRAHYFSPQDGAEVEVGTASADSDGRWAPPSPTVMQDWVLVLEAPGAADRAP